MRWPNVCGVTVRLFFSYRLMLAVCVCVYFCMPAHRCVWVCMCACLPERLCIHSLSIIVFLFGICMVAKRTAATIAVAASERWMAFYIYKMLRSCTVCRRSGKSKSIGIYWIVVHFICNAYMYVDIHGSVYYNLYTHLLSYPVPIICVCSNIFFYIFQFNFFFF